MLTEEMVINKLRSIKESVLDDDVAHSQEKELWESVLLAVAHGKCENPSILAQLALRSREINFSRWFA